MNDQLSLLKNLAWPRFKAKKNPLVVDLFCGVGGFSFGFEQAGFRTVLGVDHDQAALRTFVRNHPHATALCADLSEQRTIKNISRQCEQNQVDVLLAGPPCQGFSLTGPRNLSDPRNRLYKSAIDIAKELNPTVLILENVPGMKLLYEGRVLQDILEEISHLGYSVSAQVLLAANYGVPQMRKRLFIMGIKGKELDVHFPNSSHSEDSYVSCEAALSDLPSLEDNMGEEIAAYTGLPLSEFQGEMRKNSKHLFNHVATAHSKKVRDVIRLVPEGGNYKDLPVGVGAHRKFNEAWTRYHSKKPSRTIDTGHRNHFHYKWDRVPTVRENARLQSFPDTFQFLGTKTQQNRQVGNAVPPLLARAIAFHLKNLLSRQKTF